MEALVTALALVVRRQIYAFAVSFAFSFRSTIKVRAFLPKFGRQPEGIPEFGTLIEELRKGTFERAWANPMIPYRRLAWHTSAVAGSRNFPRSVDASTIER